MFVASNQIEEQLINLGRTLERLDQEKARGVRIRKTQVFLNGMLASALLIFAILAMAQLLS